MSDITLNDIRPILEERLNLFIQANMVLSDAKDVNNIISMMDIIEMIEIAEQEIIDQLIPEPITMNTGKTFMSGGFQKYRKDTKYIKFWDDVEANIKVNIEACFIRDSIPTGRSKVSIYPMARRFTSLVISPMIEHFQQLHPENVLVGAKPLFLWMKIFVMTADVKFHEDDIKVARQTVLRLINKKHTTSQRRYRMIEAAAEKLRMINTPTKEVYDETVRPISGKEELGC